MTRSRVVWTSLLAVAALSLVGCGRSTTLVYVGTGGPADAGGAGGGSGLGGALGTGGSTGTGGGGFGDAGEAGASGTGGSGIGGTTEATDAGAGGAEVGGSGVGGAGVGGAGTGGLGIGGAGTGGLGTGGSGSGGANDDAGRSPDSGAGGAAPPPAPCAGLPPATPIILGSYASPIGEQPYTYSAPALVAVSLTPPTVNGSTQSIQVTANPGATTDPANSYFGFGLPFAFPPCVDARAYTGVRFTVTGDLGTCRMQLSLVISEDNDVMFGPYGRCTGPVCFPPTSGLISTGTSVVHFSELTGGIPVSMVDAAALNGIQWTLTVPTDGVTAACQASFTISDVRFVDASTDQAVDDTFDHDTQGWALSTYADSMATNLGAGVSDGGVAPMLVFQPADGDPISGPGSLEVAAHFTDLDQYVDAIANLSQPGLDLTGRTLHAMVRLVSGSLPLGGVQIHASTGADHVYGSGTFLGPTDLPLGQWVPLTLSFDGITQAGFDPGAVVQLGIKLMSGFTGDVFAGPTDPVLQIDSVTD